MVNVCCADAQLCSETPTRIDGWLWNASLGCLKKWMCRCALQVLMVEVFYAFKPIECYGVGARGDWMV